MPQLLVRHKVADYRKWKSVFDDHKVVQREAGLKGGRLFRNANDPNEILVLFETNDQNETQQFAESDDLKQTMKEGLRLRLLTI